MDFPDDFPKRNEHFVHFVSRPGTDSASLRIDADTVIGWMKPQKRLTMETTAALLEERPERGRIFETGSAPEEVIHALFERFGSCIVRGCEVNGRDITPGIVALAGIDDGMRIFRIVRFGGVGDVADFPVYLALRREPYGYEASVHTVHPGLPCLRIDRDGGREWIDALRECAAEGP